MNSQTKEHFGLAALLGIPIGIMSAFVKWGGEFRLPSRSPMDMFDAACGPESAIRATDAIYEFAGHAFNYVMFTHIIFSIVFAVGYCIVAEKFPKITMWRRTSRYPSKHRGLRDLTAYFGPYAASLDAALV